MAQFMNRKQLGVTLILISLMVVLVGAEKVFNNKIKLVALMNNNINELKQYETLNGDFVYDIPSGWVVKEKNYPGNYIIYSNEFVSEDMGLVGYVQVINTTKTIEILIKEDRNLMNKDNIDSYKLALEKINNKEVSKVQYEDKTNSKKKKVYLNTVYYLDLGNNKIGKISFNCDNDKYKESYVTVYKTILESFKEAK